MTVFHIIVFCIIILYMIFMLPSVLIEHETKQEIKERLQRCIKLFYLEHKHDSVIYVAIDADTGEFCLVHMYSTDLDDSSWDYKLKIISCEELKTLAKKHSMRTFEKFKNITNENCIDYLDVQIERKDIIYAKSVCRGFVKIACIERIYTDRPIQPPITSGRWKMFYAECNISELPQMLQNDENIYKQAENIFYIEKFTDTFTNNGILKYKDIRDIYSNFDKNIEINSDETLFLVKISLTGERIYKNAVQAKNFLETLKLYQMKNENETNNR